MTQTDTIFKAIKAVENMTQDTTDNMELKPCPFCGGKAELDFKWWGKCEQYVQYFVTCNCFDNKEIDTEQKSIAAWNTRTQSPAIADTTEERQRALDCINKIENHVNQEPPKSNFIDDRHIVLQNMLADLFAEHFETIRQSLQQSIPVEIADGLADALQKSGIDLSDVEKERAISAYNKFKKGE